MSELAIKAQPVEIEEPHPFADIFPLMNDAELKVLSDDILKNGLRLPITVRDKKILDGRNRFRACRMVSVQPIYEELPADKDPLAFVISANLHRRHLNETQRGVVAARLTNMQRGGKEANPSKDGIAPISQAKAAELLNVSSKTVERAAKLIKGADAKLVTAAETGKVKVARAVEFLDKPEEERRKLIADNGNDVIKAVKNLKGGNSSNGNSGDAFDAAQKSLLERFKSIEDPNTAETAAQQTITQLVVILKLKKPKFSLKVT
jgi:hypothetical protein